MASRKQNIILLGGLVLAVILSALGVIYTNGFRNIHAVEITRGQGLRIPENLRSMINDTPDFYLKIKTRKGVIETKPLKNQPVGNGLLVAVSPRVRLDQVQEIELWDSDLMDPDELLDRIRIKGRQGSGDHYHFELEGPLPVTHAVAWAVLVLSGLGFLIVTTGMIRAGAFPSRARAGSVNGTTEGPEYG